MYGSEKSMGPIPCMVLRGLRDRSHSSHGTSNYRSLFVALCKVLIYQVPYMVLKGLWDQSHVWFLEAYGTGPIAHLVLQNIGIFL